MSGRRAVKFYQADVFTSTVFGGNPVAVVPEAAGLTDGEMQKIAREMNLSETVFVLPVSAPGGSHSKPSRQGGWNRFGGGGGRSRPV